MINRPDVIKAALSVGITDFDRARIGYNKMNVYEKEVWNEAIETAAQICKYREDYELIRKLNK